MYNEIIPIVMPSSCRLEFLKPTLEHLAACRQVSQFKLFAYLELCENSEKAAELIKELGPSSEVYINAEPNLGLMMNCSRAVISTMMKTNSDYLVVLEDDMILARSALCRFLFWASYLDRNEHHLPAIAGVVSGKPPGETLEGVVAWVGTYVPMFCRSFLDMWVGLGENWGGHLMLPYAIASLVIPNEMVYFMPKNNQCRFLINSLVDDKGRLNPSSWYSTFLVACERLQFKMIWPRSNFATNIGWHGVHFPKERQQAGGINGLEGFSHYAKDFNPTLPFCLETEGDHLPEEYYKQVNNWLR